MSRYDDDDFDHLDVRTDVRAEAATRVFVPAMFILVVSALSFLGAACFLVFLTVMLLVEPPRNQPDDIIGVVVLFGGCGVFLVMRGIIAVGAILMARMRLYPLAITVAVMQIMPMCSFCWMLEMALGIWALIILLQPEVREAFYAEDQ